MEMLHEEPYGSASETSLVLIHPRLQHYSIDDHLCFAARIRPSHASIVASHHVDHLAFHYTCSHTSSEHAFFRRIQNVSRSESLFPQPKMATPTLLPMIPLMCLKGVRLVPFLPIRLFFFPSTICHSSLDCGHCCVCDSEQVVLG